MPEDHTWSTWSSSTLMKGRPHTLSMWSTQLAFSRTKPGQNSRHSLTCQKSWALCGSLAHLSHLNSKIRTDVLKTRVRLFSYNCDVTVPLDRYGFMLWAGGGQSVTKVSMGTERGSCSEACDPLTWIWGEMLIMLVIYFLWCRGKKFVFPWMEISILLSSCPLLSEVPVYQVTLQFILLLTGFLDVSSLAVRLHNI